MNSILATCLTLLGASVVDATFVELGTELDTEFDLLKHAKRWEPTNEHLTEACPFPDIE